jgi:alkanesulfonate monooxygenase SsuD/methylene tetrahydromethanopterin reductase-like flavin-dependent oxidoreductase (luciferase family)
MPDPLRFIASMPRLRKNSVTRVSEVRRLETSGFDTVAVSRHVTNGWQLAPLAAMAFAAASTSRLRVLSLVVQNDVHHPALLAKDISTIDAPSHGRVELGIGTGWLADDYTALGLTLESGRTRTARLEEEWGTRLFGGEVHVDSASPETPALVAHARNPVAEAVGSEHPQTVHYVRRPRIPQHENRDMTLVSACAAASSGRIPHG